MSWLSSIETLAHLLERQTHHWICFLQYESPLVARHPQAADQSRASSMCFSSEEPRIRCFFAADPIVECCESVARDFYSHPLVQSSSTGAFLIPYTAADEFERPQPVPFLKFACDNFLELSGSLNAAEPQLRAGGHVLERCLSALDEQIKSELSVSNTATSDRKASIDGNAWQPSESRQSLREMFETLKSLMRDGESYLANASTRLYGPARTDARVSLSSFVLRWLESPSRFGVFVDCGADLPAVVCFSPERFVLRCGSALITEPIKGTAKVELSEPALGASSLWNSTKEMCEQKMVADLLRNDLNALCVPGSVCVDAPFAMRRAGELLQMQSVISGQLQQPLLSHADIFRHMLPAGSVTGTPKHAVGQQLRALEKSPRGYYTGIFALADDAFHFESTLLIRGFFANKDHWEVGIGAGITTLSDIEFELEEFDLKWQSFARRWPDLPEHGHLPPDLESCQKLLCANIFQQKQEIQEAPRGVSAPLIELGDSVDLCANDLRGKILFVDHIDSFSGNLIAALRAQDCAVARVISAPISHKFLENHTQPISLSSDFIAHLLALVVDGVFSALVFSPGPGRPEDYPLSQQLLRAWPRTKPLLGVCLGHQLLLTNAGCSLERAAETPVHGRSQCLRELERAQWLEKLALERQQCTFYNSWSVACGEAQIHAPQWRICATVGGFNSDKSHSFAPKSALAEESVAFCEHRENPWFGVQFHPESFATVPGKSLITAFVALCRSGA
jgi:anthranilate/para-aminobenzoate synthase component I/anthranilate/para-aminobenzoate synthase component II